jgi:succinoglycan biosynthesis protein ExoV
VDIVHYRAKGGNFGDDLNDVIWQNLLPPDVLEAPDALLLGIGTIFSEAIAPVEKVAGKRVFVLGSGAGYTALPRDFSRWHILATRGPLTARIIERPETGVTDSAVLLAAIPDLMPPPGKRDLKLFMPHYRSTSGSNWDKVAAEAGLTYVDPRWPVDRILEFFSKAELVVSEAMHGAIVADAMRIPWIPVAISNDFLPLKWCDWTQSIEVPFQPSWLPPSSLWEELRLAHEHRVAARHGIALPRRLSVVTDAEELVADFRKRQTLPHASISQAGKSPDSIFRSLGRLAARNITWPHVGRAAAALSGVAKGPSFLSRDGVIKDRIEQLLSSTEAMVNLIRHD